MLNGCAWQTRLEQSTPEDKIPWQLGSPHWWKLSFMQCLCTVESIHPRQPLYPTLLLQGHPSAGASNVSNEQKPSKCQTCCECQAAYTSNTKRWTSPGHACTCADVWVHLQALYSCNKTNVSYYTFLHAYAYMHQHKARHDMGMQCYLPPL